MCVCNGDGEQCEQQMRRWVQGDVLKVNGVP
jgi:hypothetical protein